MDKRDSILREMVIIFRKELEDPDLQISYSSSADTVEKWDSVTNLVLISAVEDKFGIIFSVDSIFEIRSIGDMVDYIVKSTSA